MATQPRHRAVVLSRYDLPNGPDLLVTSCEDCACPVSGDLAPSHSAPAQPSAPGMRWFRAPDLAEFPLDSNHQLVFNPLGSAGAVVVNRPAREILNGFGRPAAPEDVARALPGLAADVATAVDRFRDLELLYREGSRAQPQFGAARTLTAWLHVTNGCNLRCPYCYLNKSAQAMDEATGRAAVAAVFRSATEHRFGAVKLKYAGGEASMNHRLVAELHAYASALAAETGLRLEATLLTNGVKLPASLVQTCRAGDIKVMISLDGIGDAHDAQRPFGSGKPTFHLVEQTIAGLVGQGLPPHLSVTITGRNVRAVPDVVRFALERDLTFSLNLFRDNDCASGFADLQYEEQEMISGLLDAFAVVEEFLPRWSVLGSLLDRGQLLQPRQRSCGVGQDYVVIDQRGRVAKCHMEIERTIGDVFASDPLQLVRQDTTTALNLVVDEKEGCRDCSWRYWCSGGCSVATFRATGRYDIKSPNCHIYQAIYPMALRLEGLRLLKYAQMPSEPRASVIGAGSA